MATRAVAHAIRLLASSSTFPSYVWQPNAQSFRERCCSSEIGASTSTIQCNKAMSAGSKGRDWKLALCLGREYVACMYGTCIMSIGIYLSIYVSL